MENQTDFSSRIGLRGVGAATMVTLSLMVLLVSLLAGIGLWNFNLNEMPMIGSAFWITSTLAWFVSVFVGGFMAASTTRSTLMRDGLFNAITTWSASYLIFGAAMMFFAPEVVQATISNASSALLFLAFLADAISLGVCLYGGSLGVKFEQAEFKRRESAETYRPFEEKRSAS